MGNVYSVSMELKNPKKRELIKLLKSIGYGETEIAGYKFDKLKGIDTAKTFLDYMKVYFPDEDSSQYAQVNGRNIIINTCFNGSYTWELIMTELFAKMCPFIGSGSDVELYMDEGKRELKCIKGKCFEQGQLFGAM